jgi:aspartate aminotransferase
VAGELGAETGSGISELRERIRKVTLGIVDLMAERERLVRELSKVKAAAGESPFNPEVERELRTVAMADLSSGSPWASP